MKKVWTLLFVILYSVSGFPLIPTQTANAAADKYTYSTGVSLNDEGNLVYINKNKTATSSIRYGTKAFILRVDDPSTTSTNEGETCYSTSISSQCTPLSGRSDVQLRINVYDNSGKPNSDITEPYAIPGPGGRSPNECEYIKQKYNLSSTPTSGCDPGVTISHFEISAKTLEDDYFKGKPLFEKLQEGGTLYFNTIFRIRGDSKYPEFSYEIKQNCDTSVSMTCTSKKGTTDNGMRYIEPWLDNSYFRAFYDQPVEFHSRKYKVTLKTKIEGTGDQLVTDKVQPGEYKAGAPVKVTLDPTITTGGKTYELVCSYLENELNPKSTTCGTAGKGNEPWFLRDAGTLSRNPTVPLGGLNIIAFYKLAGDDCKCTTSATIPNKSSLEGEVPVDNTTIGKKITMQVDMQQTPDSIEDWKNWVKNKTSFRIKVRVYRSDQTDVMTGLSNTGVKAIWSKGSGLDPADDANPDKWNTVTSDQLISYLSGGSTSKVLFNDDLTSYKIPEGGKVSFRYNADVYIQAKDASGTIVTKQCTRPGPSTEMSWFRQKKDPPGVANFTSVPKYYSEIKEGSPQLSGTSSNETFDAMSGTPTTRSLYFASGGSEFIVDVQVEYVPKVTKTRTYRSYFTPVTNGWAMSPITGPTGHGSQPPAPTARVKTDDAGQTYQEIVTPHQFKHVTKPAVPCSGTPCTGGSPEESETDYYWVQEGYDFHTVGGYEDTWTQTVTFDYMKINKAVVWKIDKSRVDGMAALVGTSAVTATITQGDPNVFYNIASADTSAAGRLRYSLETNQHDNVVWNEGESDNSLANNKSGKVNEQKKFDERRAMTTNVTAVSDFLILQTSTGDQAVLYFDKQSNTAKVTDQLDVPVTNFDTMWTNNSNSAAKWNALDTIHVGSYNGNFGSPQNKYSGGSLGTVTTIFDSLPAGLNRPSRPAPYMRLMKTGLNIPITLKNGEYLTGSSSVFYKLLFAPYNPKSLPIPYNTGTDSVFGAQGQSFTSSYSPIHSKINDVVIHDPVSVQNAMVVSLPDKLDQRTTPPSENLIEGVAEYERVLNPNYRQNIVPNPDAEILNADGTVAGWNTWVAAGSASNIAFTSRTGDQWVIAGLHTFEVNSAASSGTRGGYWKDIPVKSSTDYRFEADMSCHRCTGYFSLDLYDAGKSFISGGFGSSDTSKTATVQHKTINFTTTANTAYVRIHLIKDANIDASQPRDNLFADNLSLKNMSVQEFVAVDPVPVTQVVANPDYKPASTSDPVAETFNFTGSVQTFTAPSTGSYTLEAWGAQGGNSTYDARVQGGLGGYAKGNINLTAGEIIHVYVGGQSGWNGGGAGSGTGSGNSSPGGGATDIRRGGTALTDRIIVGGGGGGTEYQASPGNNGTMNGGPFPQYGGGHGGGLVGGTGLGDYAGSDNGAGGTQTSGYALGEGGPSVGNHSGGGGGGYYGGFNGRTNNNYAGGGGSGYVGGVTSGSMLTGVRSGNGMAVISAPGTVIPAVGNPNKIITTYAGGSDTSPPSDAYILKPIAVNPSQPAGGFTPGKFILLDYGFQVYFPNTGDFFGNGQWGWAQTTEMRGKGFTDNMDTTEWTKSKYVKFDFNVIYNDEMYRSNTWIQLPVTSPGMLYDFYVPLADREKVSAVVQYKSLAINAVDEDNDTWTNKVRYPTQERPYAARHSALKQYTIDVVGRIGNMVIEDTGDFRFSNLFKQPLVPAEWLIPNVVARVNPNKQNKIIGDTVDIRGNTVSSATRFLNTWGMMTHEEQSSIAFPLSPVENNIAALRNQPLRIGYDVLSDIQTIGNYYSNMQITPYYYNLNLKTGAITQVDIYMNVDGQYKIINRFGGGSAASVYNNPVKLDWTVQAGRRNVSAKEADQTTRIANLFAESGGETTIGKAAQPSENYLYGNSQFMQLTGRNRTYIGQDTTYGVNKNPGNILSQLEFGMQAQRWHFSYVLPSSAVAVKTGLPATRANIEAMRTNTSVLVLAADIKAIGDTYTLQYKAPNGNGSLTIAGTTWPLTSIQYPVIAVYSANKSSADDLSVSGTH